MVPARGGVRFGAASTAALPAAPLPMMLYSFAGHIIDSAFIHIYGETVPRLAIGDFVRRASAFH